MNDRTIGRDIHDIRRQTALIVNWTANGRNDIEVGNRSLALDAPLMRNPRSLVSVRRTAIKQTKIDVLNIKTCGGGIYSSFVCDLVICGFLFIVWDSSPCC